MFVSPSIYRRYIITSPILYLYIPYLFAGSVYCYSVRSWEYLDRIKKRLTFGNNHCRKQLLDRFKNLRNRDLYFHSIGFNIFFCFDILFSTGDKLLIATRSLIDSRYSLYIFIDN